MRQRSNFPWAIVALVAVGAALIIAAIVTIGPPGSSARTEHTLVTAEDGVVQSTVTGTGNVEPGVDDTVNFKVSGTLQAIDVHVGEHVTKGQLLGTLDPASAQLTLDEANDDLTSAQDALDTAESGSTTSTSYDRTTAADTEFVSYTPGTSTSSNEGVTVVGGNVPSSTTPSSTTPTTTTPTTTTPSTGSTHTTGRSGSSGSGTGTAGTGTSGSTGSGSSGSGSSRSSGSGSSGSGSSGSGSSTDPAASEASDEASVDSAKAAVSSARQALDDTKLYAPASGTVVSLESISPGDSITGSSSGSSTSSTSSSTGSSSTGASGTTAGGLGDAGSTGSTDSSSSSTSSSGFAEIVNSSQLTMTVAFSEADISQIKVGQAATVTLDALTGVELGAHVTAIDTVGSTSDGVVSYNATLTLNQNDSQVLPGMSASASVITGQATGVNLPNDAITGSSSLSTVSVEKNGKTTSQQVVVGMKGDSRTLIVSGLSAGEQVMVTTVLPAISTSSASTSSSSSTGTLGGAGAGAGASGFAARALAGGGGGGFFRGGGGGG